MRKLIIAEHISLDGVIQSPGGHDEDSSDGFDLGGWTAPYADPVIQQALQDLFAQPFELLLGRRTYDIWAAYWPHARSGAIADRFNGTRKHVATHRPGTLEWHGSQALVGDPANAVRELKRQDGADLMTWGSGHLLRQLLAAGLVDEIRLLVYPVVLGRGKRLFDDRARPSAFTLAHSATGASGVISTRYVRGEEVGTEPRSGSGREDQVA